MTRVTGVKTVWTSLPAVSEEDVSVILSITAETTAVVCDMLTL